MLKPPRKCLAPLLKRPNRILHLPPPFPPPTGQVRRSRRGRRQSDSSGSTRTSWAWTMPRRSPPLRLNRFEAQGGAGQTSTKPSHSFHWEIRLFKKMAASSPRKRTTVSEKPVGGRNARLLRNGTSGRRRPAPMGQSAFPFSTSLTRQIRRHCSACRILTRG